MLWYVLYSATHLVFLVDLYLDHTGKITISRYVRNSRIPSSLFYLTSIIAFNMTFWFISPVYASLGLGFWLLGHFCKWWNGFWCCSKADPRPNLVGRVPNGQDDGQGCWEHQTIHRSNSAGIRQCSDLLWWSANLQRLTDPTRTWEIRTPTTVLVRYQGPVQQDRSAVIYKASTWEMLKNMASFGKMIPHAWL